MEFLTKYRFLLLRRSIQISVLTLFVLGNYAGFKILQGNYSSSLLLDKVPLSDPFALLQIMAAGGIFGANVVVGAIIVFAVYALIGGRIFCSYVCPMNMVTDFARVLHKAISADKLRQNLLFSRNIRYYAAALALILSSILNIAAFEAISPIGLLHRNVIFGFGFGFIVVLALFIFDLFALKNGFCGHICPLGGFYALISRFSLLRIRYSVQKCTNCMKCKMVCPEKQVLNLVGEDQNQFVSSGECTRCGRCIEVCNNDALSFSIFRFIKKDINYENNID